MSTNMGAFIALFILTAVMNNAVGNPVSNRSSFDVEIIRTALENLNLTLSNNNSVLESGLNVSLPKLSWHYEEGLNHFNLDEYIIIARTFSASIRTILANIHTHKHNLETSVDNFQNMIQTNLENFNTIISNLKISSSCPNMNCIEKYCLKYIPNKINFQAVYDLFSDFLLFKFNNSLSLLTRKVEKLEIAISTTQEKLKFNKSNTNLKDSDYWKLLKKITIKSLFNLKRDIWNGTNVVIEDLMVLEDNERLLEKSVVNKIAEDILSFSCCTKRVDFVPVGSKCKELEEYRTDSDVGVSFMDDPHQNDIASYEDGDE